MKILILLVILVGPAAAQTYPTLQNLQMRCEDMGEQGKKCLEYLTKIAEAQRAMAALCPDDTEAMNYWDDRLQFWTEALLKDYPELFPKNIDKDPD